MHSPMMTLNQRKKGRREGRNEGGERLGLVVQRATYDGGDATTDLLSPCVQVLTCYTSGLARWAYH
jgi:hypothetical protein